MQIYVGSAAAAPPLEIPYRSLAGTSLSYDGSSRIKIELLGAFARTLKLLYIDAGSEFGTLANFYSGSSGTATLWSGASALRRAR
jgi:hypothetical protein